MRHDFSTKDSQPCTVEMNQFILIVLRIAIILDFLNELFTVWGEFSSVILSFVPDKVVRDIDKWRYSRVNPMHFRDGTPCFLLKGNNY